MMMGGGGAHNQIFVPAFAEPDVNIALYLWVTQYIHDDCSPQSFNNVLSALKHNHYRFGIYIGTFESLQNISLVFVCVCVCVDYKVNKPIGLLSIFCITYVAGERWWWLRLRTEPSDSYEME